MIPLHTRALCDNCGDPATVEIDSGVFLCDRCEGGLLAAMFNSLSPAASQGVNAATAGLAPSAVAATFSNSSPLDSPREVLGPLPVAGMSGDPADAGGKDDAGLTALSIGSSEKSAACEITSLIAVDCKLNTQRTGTAPGASGPECDLIGAPNSHCEPEQLEITVVRMGELASQPARRPTPLAPFDRNSNTLEASSTARKAPSGWLLGQPSRISDRASFSFGRLRVGDDFESIVTALEAEWLSQSTSLAQPILKNSTSFASRAFDSMSASLTHESELSFDVPST